MSSRFFSTSVKASRSPMPSLDCVSATTRTEAIWIGATTLNPSLFR
jgi:hypothetical protein